MNFDRLKKIALTDAQKVWLNTEKPSGVKAIYSDGFVMVQEYHIHWRPRFKKLLVRHLVISTNNAIRLHKFEDIMKIKDIICGPESEAVQVYPKASAVTDEDYVMHLYVFPKGFSWPLTVARNW